MSQVYDVLQRWIDAQRIPPTQAQLARLLGVSRGTISNWKADTVPRPAQVDTIVERTGISKPELLTAVLRDLGYLRVDSWLQEGGGDDAATQDGQGPAAAEKLRRRAREASPEQQPATTPGRPGPRLIAGVPDQQG